MKFIEDLLYEKTKDKKSEILFTQWSYDKVIIPKVLSSISNLFPHYSLHDESHSSTIINNIIRLLGIDSISKLSSIDLWLILEASYYHDIGMVVSGEEFADTIKSDDFFNFFKNIYDDKNHKLNEFAILFIIENKQIKFKNESISNQYFDAIKFILAEFFRHKHSNRSEDLIVEPNIGLTLISPRNSMPIRIFKVLGKICSSHTKNFEDVMNLPFCEVGIDTEDMHPRFIACLLRLGDLLDLDNDRFSKIILNTLYKLPKDTLLHERKHLAIENFRVDTKIISIIAKCEDYESAEITQHWFDYINSEITNQMLKWNEIVPTKEIGYLPTIEELKVKLSPYEYIDGRNRPQFKVDTEKALELLKGAGIYETPEQSFREILQNAVDSTFIRIWEENKEDKNLFEIPNNDKFLKLVENYPIEIHINSKNSLDNEIEWEIIIIDNAMGISMNDLKYLMNSGSSSKNIQKMKLINAMPNWLKPSGIFGIGFQSIFQLTEKVIIETKDYFTEEFKILTTFSPSSNENGAILIEKRESSHKIKPGSKLIFNIKTKKIPDSYSFNYDNSFTKDTIESFDYFKFDSFDIELAKILDEIQKFFTHVYIPINLKLNGKEISLDKTIDKKPFKYYEKDNYMELNIFPNNEEYKYGVGVFYRNQLVSKNNIRIIKFLGLDVNILKDKASDVLTINRNEIKKDYNSSLIKDLFESLYEIITKHYDDFLEAEQKVYLSMFLHFNFSEEKNLDSKFDDWIKLNFGSINILEILKKDMIVIRYFKKGHPLDNNRKNEFTHENDSLIIDIYQDEFSKQNEEIEFLFFKLRNSCVFMSIKIELEKDDLKKEVTLSKNKQQNVFDDTSYNQIIKSLFSKSGYENSNREFIPLQIEDVFKKLRVKNNSFIPWVTLNMHCISIIDLPIMLSPFIKENDRVIGFVNEKLYEWVYENRFYDEVTIEEIKTTYIDFINKYKNH